MPTAQALLGIASKWIGYTEGPNSDTRFGIEYGWDNVSWCDIFVWCMFHEAGITMPVKTAACNTSAGYAMANGLWIHPATARPGDQIIFDWTGAQNGAQWALTHTGLVESNDGVTITTIEGNAGPYGQVVRNHWPVDSNLIWGVISWQHLFTAAPQPAPASGNRFRFEPMIQLGSTGQAVKDAQYAIDLIDPARRLVVDGEFGPITRQVVIALQGFYRVAGGADGIVGPNTWKALDAALTAKGR